MSSYITVKNEVYLFSFILVVVWVIETPLTLSTKGHMQEILDTGHYRMMSGAITLNNMGLLPDTQNCGLRMRRECRERFPCHQGLAMPTCTYHGYAMREVSVNFTSLYETN